MKVRTGWFGKSLKIYNALLCSHNAFLERIDYTDRLSINLTNTAVASTLPECIITITVESSGRARISTTAWKAPHLSNQPAFTRLIAFHYGDMQTVPCSTSRTSEWSGSWRNNRTPRTPHFAHVRNICWCDRFNATWSGRWTRMRELPRCIQPIIIYLCEIGFRFFLIVV